MALSLRACAGLALLALTFGLFGFLPRFDVKATSSRRLAHGSPTSEELTAADEEETENPFWRRALQELVEEGVEIARRDVMGEEDVRATNGTESCEEHLRKGEFVAAFSRGCEFVEGATKHCFDTMDSGTSTQFLIGSMLRDCIAQPGKWRQTFQACEAALSPKFPVIGDVRSALRTACIRSCLEQSTSCPDRHFGDDSYRYDSYRWAAMALCVHLMDPFIDRLTIHAGYDAKTFVLFHGAIAFQGAAAYPSSHHYDRFVLLQACLSKGHYYTMQKSLFGDRPRMYILDPDNSLHRAVTAFLKKEPLPSEILVAPGWGDCEEIIDRGVANTSASAVRQCRNSCAQNFIPSTVWHEYGQHVLLQGRLWIGGCEIPLGGWLFVSFVLTLLSTLLSFATLCTVTLCKEKQQNPALELPPLWQGILVFVIQCFWLFIFFACVIGEYLLGIMRGHGVAWACTKALLHVEGFDPKLQYVGGAVALMMATGLGSVLPVPGSLPTAPPPPRQIVGLLLLAELLLVLCPASFWFVLQQFDPLQQEKEGLQALVWWLGGSAGTALCGLALYAAVAHCYGRSLSQDAQELYKVPGKLMMVDIFMDVSQAVNFFLIGQPFFGMAQTAGVLANAFLSEIAPHVPSQKVQNEVLQVLGIWHRAGRLWHDASWTRRMYLCGVFCVALPILIWCRCFMVFWGFLILILIVLYVGSVAYFLVVWSFMAVLSCCLRWRAFTSAIFQADVLPLVWHSYQSGFEMLPLLNKKCAEATGEGTCSLYIGLIALFKARLGSNSNVMTLVSVLGNVLMTTYSVQAGLASLEIKEAETQQTHRASLKGSTDWRLPDGRIVVEGRLVSAETATSRTLYKEARNVAKVSAMRSCEILCMAVPFTLLGASYNFLVPVLMYMAIGSCLGIVSIANGNDASFLELLFPFLPWQEPITVPTASSSFAWAGASRLTAAILSWLLMFTEGLWAPLAPSFDSQKSGFFAYLSEKRQWLQEGELNLAEVLQALTVFVGALLGILSWFGYFYMWVFFLPKREEWRSEDSARLLAKSGHGHVAQLLQTISADTFSDFTGSQEMLAGVPKFEELPEGPASDAEDELWEAPQDCNDSGAETEAERADCLYPELNLQSFATFHYHPSTATADNTKTMLLGMRTEQWSDLFRKCPRAFPSCISNEFTEGPLSVTLKSFVGRGHDSEIILYVCAALLPGTAMFQGRIQEFKDDVLQYSGQISGEWRSEGQMKWEEIHRSSLNRKTWRPKWFHPPEGQPEEQARGCLVMPNGMVLTEAAQAIVQDSSKMYIPCGRSLFHGQALQIGREPSELKEGYEIYEVLAGEELAKEFPDLPPSLATSDGAWRFVGLRPQPPPPEPERPQSLARALALCGTGGPAYSQLPGEA